MFVVAKEAGSPGPHIIRNYSIPEENQITIPWNATSSGDLRIKDAARATGPFHFPPTQEHEDQSHMVSGVDNPTDIMLAEVMAITGLQPRNAVGLVVSLGCGSDIATASIRNKPLQRLCNHYGAALANHTMLIDEVARATSKHQQMKQQCERDGIPYIRFSPVLKEPGQLDATKPEQLKALMDPVEEVEEGREGSKWTKKLKKKFGRWATILGGEGEKS